MANPEIQRAFVAAGGEKPKREPKPRRAPARKQGIKPGGKLPQKSEKKTLTDKIHDAYRDAFIFLARRYDDLRCWECGIECTPKQLHLHHLERRGRGGGHFAANYALVCNRFSANGENNCHDRLDNNDVRWTKGKAS